MKVWIRPGPYICSEWDMGGMPARLFSIDYLAMRAFDKHFLNEVWTYFSHLSKIIKPFT